LFSCSENLWKYPIPAASILSPGLWTWVKVESLIETNQTATPVIIQNGML
jgi:hypothetical protein